MSAVAGGDACVSPSLASAMLVSPTRGRAPDPPQELTARERAHYARDARALALLCECAPYVDEPDCADMSDDLLGDACRHDPLAWRRDGERREIALRAPAPD